MKTPRRILVSLFFIFGLFAARVFAADASIALSRYVLAVSSERPEALHHQGEPVTFRIRLELDGRPVRDAEVQWTTSKDGVAPIQKGRCYGMDRRPSAVVSTNPGFCNAVSPTRRVN